MPDSPFGQFLDPEAARRLQEMMAKMYGPGQMPGGLMRNPEPLSGPMAMGIGDIASIPNRAIAGGLAPAFRGNTSGILPGIGSAFRPSTEPDYTGQGTGRDVVNSYLEGMSKMNPMVGAGLKELGMSRSADMSPGQNLGLDLAGSLFDVAVGSIPYGVMPNAALNSAAKSSPSFGRVNSAVRNMPIDRNFASNARLATNPQQLDSAAKMYLGGGLPPPMRGSSEEMARVLPRNTWGKTPGSVEWNVRASKIPDPAATSITPTPWYAKQLDQQLGKPNTMPSSIVDPQGFWKQDPRRGSGTKPQGFWSNSGTPTNPGGGSAGNLSRQPGRQVLSPEEEARRSAIMEMLTNAGSR